MTETAREDVIEGIPSPATRDGRPTSVVFALVSLATLLAVLGVGLLAFDAPLPLMMIVGFGVSLVIATIRGVTYEAAENAAFDMIRRGLQALLIFVAVGALIASWILSGTVPTMIYLGVELIEPTFFLPTAIVLCAITSFINGTNFGTVATIGLALMGVASALDIPAGIAAGAIISGAIFGDKMSPVSDTTVLAAGLSDVPLIQHIRHMMWTTVPAILICLIVFTVVGMNHDADASGTAGIDDVASALDTGFSIGWIPLIPPVLVFGLLMARIEAFPALSLGVVAGVAVAVWYQGVDLTTTLLALWEGYVPTEAQADSAGLL
ncbi:MAG: Na+/H+ antiporter NhaC family protein, partial [Nocardioidaceae bacterium]